MNKRIKAISSYINSDDRVIDIGCDQALLSEILAKKGIYSLASDIKEDIVSNAKKRINSLGLDKYVKFNVSNGIENIDYEYDTIVLAGMGTFTILNILNKLNDKVKKIITISNNNHYLLRKEMSNFGYKIDKEEIIYDKDKFYNLIIFIPGSETYNEEELLFGVNHTNIELLNKKLEYELNKYKKLYNEHKSSEIKNKIKVIEKRLKNH